MDEAYVKWMGQDCLRWTAKIGIDKNRPCIFELSCEDKGIRKFLAGPLYPQFEVTTGIRRVTAKRQSMVRDEKTFYEARWNTYADHPLGRKDEVKQAKAVFQTAKMEISHKGGATYADFDGLEMGHFTGGVRFTFWEGCNLIKYEAIASNQEESLAYLYRAALSGFKAGRLYYHDLDRETVREYPRRRIGKMEDYVRVNARNRLLALDQEGGSVAVLPPPHKFFWARQNENCVGYNYYRLEEDGGLTIGVRHNEEHEYKGDRWALYNAPSGTAQHMAAFLCVCSSNAMRCRTMAMGYTNGDVFRPLEGFKRMLSHFHMAYHLDYEQDPDRINPWEKLFREIGCDIAMLCDFWGDGNLDGSGEDRRRDLKLYQDACRAHSDENFLIIPAEEMADLPEASEKLCIPGHWMFLPSKPVLYSRFRGEGQPFVEDTPDGKYYHWGSPDDVLEMCRRENGFLFMPHPETKANDGFPCAVKEETWFQDPLYWGMGFRYLPADNATRRLIDGRVADVWNDMNNWADRPRYCMGELDTYRKELRWDMYGDMNVTYVKVDKLPSGEDWSAVVDALKAGEAFVSTGEILIEDSLIRNGEAQLCISWTFPMEFAEVVYSDGETVHNREIDMAGSMPYGRAKLHFQFPTGMKWARLAAWDAAGNGAFGQPVFLEACGCDGTEDKDRQKGE